MPDLTLRYQNKDSNTSVGLLLQLFCLFLLLFFDMKELPVKQTGSPTLQSAYL